MNHPHSSKRKRCHEHLLSNYDLEKKHSVNKPLAITVDGQEFMNNMCRSDILQSCNPKLTKQQKRDAKRALEKPSTNRLTGYSNESSKIDGKVVEEKKNSVYKRITVLPTEYGSSNVKDRFLVPSDVEYQDVLQKSYLGFHTEPPEGFSEEFHSKFYGCFEELETCDIFQFDYTQPAGLGTKVAKTFVSRCLVGDAGITYKYLGIRMFAHPWNNYESNIDNILPCFKTIKTLNNQLVKKSKKLLGDLKKKEYGSCAYNLTLINRCFPVDGGDIKLKYEPTFKKDKCTVSWHADSTLEHFSTIAVYHCLKPQLSSDKEKSTELGKFDDDSWRITLRVSPHAEGPTAQKMKSNNKIISSSSNTNTHTHIENSMKLKKVNMKHGADTIETKGNNGNENSENVMIAIAPPVAVPLPNKWSYFLLDDFNHHHQHSVLAGNSHRYASTHRVCRVEGHTYESIKHRCESILSTGFGFSPKQLKNEQNILNDVEFEWIRQFYIQGKRHYEIHNWWHVPMQELIKLWGKLEYRTLLAIRTLTEAAGE